MTQIIGTIANSVGDPLDGILAFSLPAVITTDTTNPDTIYTPKTKEFAIVGGAVAIEVPETETAETAYRIVFTEDQASAPLFDLFGIVPKVGPLNLANLFPTGITNRNLDTGALRVSRLIATDVNLSQLVKQPATASLFLSAETVERKLYLPRPFSGGVLLRSISVLALSGVDDWIFGLGVVNGSGAEEVLTSISEISVTQGGRTHIIKTYAESRTSSILGFFLSATPGVGAGQLTASLSISYTEL